MSIPSGSWPSTDANGIDLIDPVCITHQGAVVLFARQAGIAVDFLYYNVMIASAADSSDAGLWQGWSYLPMTEPSQADVPITQASADEQSMMRIAGADLITVPPIASTLSPADAPFRVVSDGRHICVFRLSTDKTLYVDRFILVQGTPAAVPRLEASAGTTWTVSRAWEIRYRRSELRDIPAGSNDNLDCRNMLGEPFLEPTMEISALEGLDSSGFDVVLAPTSDPQAHQWHFFWVRNNVIECISWSASATGRVIVGTATPSVIQPLLTISDGSTRAVTVIAGISATVYAERERAGDDGAPNIARGVRLMLCVPVACPEVNVPAGMAIFDFLIRTDGTIPAWPTQTAVIPVDGTLTTTGFTPAGDAAAFSIPDSAIHVVGTATVAGVFLGQPQPAATPRLHDGSAGLVHLYFAGVSTTSDTQPLLVAQFDPTVTRATAEIAWTAETQSGEVLLIAQRPGTTMNGMTATVSDCVGQPDLCNLVLDYGPTAGLPTETWSGVPRALNAFCAVLDGSAASMAADPRALSGEVPFFDYSGTRAQIRLPLGSASSPTGCVVLVSKRPDLELASATIESVAESTVRLVLEYAYTAGRIVQTWAAVPQDGRRFAAVLACDVSPAVYPYQPAATDHQVYGLATEGGTILLINSAGTPTLTIAVRSATDLNPEHCDISIATAAQSLAELTNIGRSQADVITALHSTGAFSYISPDPLGANIVNQTIASALDLRAAASLLNALPPTIDGPVVATTVTQPIVQTHVLSPAPIGRMASALYAATVVPLNRPLLGRLATITNGVAAVSARGQYGSWCIADTPQALSMSATSAVAVDLDQPAAQRLIPGRQWTLEGWCNPAEGRESRILSYNNRAATEFTGVVPSYFVGTIGLPALEYLAYNPVANNYDATYIQIKGDPHFNIADPSVAAMTWEAWVNPRPQPCPPGLLGCIVQGLDTDNDYVDIPVFEIGLDSERKLTFGFRTTGASGQPVVQKFGSQDALPASIWTHVAVVGRRTNAGWAFQLFINGVPNAATAGVVLFPDSTVPFVAIGANDSSNVSLFGNLAEVRFWIAARTRQEIERTMNTSLTGLEPGLYGYWPLDQYTPGSSPVFTNHAVATSGSDLNGTLFEQAQPFQMSDDGTFVGIVAGVGGAPAVRANTFFRSTHWNHFAVVYEASGALQLNLIQGNRARLDYGSCADSADVLFATQNSIEAWVRIPAKTSIPQAILAQWGVADSDQCFQFGIGANGTPSFTINVIPSNDSEQTITAAGPVNVCDGNPHHIAVTWSVARNDVDATSLRTICTVQFFVDGVPAEPIAVEFKNAYEVQVASSSAPLTLGIRALESATSGVVALEAQAPFQGVLTGVRFWSITLNADQVANAMQKNRDYDSAQGAVAAWWFDEDEGLDAADSIGDSDMVLSDTDMWCAFAHIATVDVYGNGIHAGRLAPYAAPDYMGATGFTVGAFNNAGTLQDSFIGQLAEFRLWSTTRAQNQIREAMYHALLGSESDLRAYWRFDDDLIDLTGGGNDGKDIGSNTYVPSSAPIANEGSQVRNVYGGPMTDFQEFVQGTPAVLDYGDTERNSHGEPIGVMRRCYFYNNPNLTLTTQYSVGELDLVYIGMAQTQPTLIGYIEGAPPVPSENLTRPLYNSFLGYNSYADASRVALTQVESTSLTFSSSDFRTAITMDLDFKRGLLVSMKLDSFLGAVSTEALVHKTKVGLHQKDSLVRAKQTDEKYVSAWTRTYTNIIGLRGAWEPEGKTQQDYLNPQVGRRYQPANTGYALVESLTGDVYAMCTKGTGTSIGKVVIPNLAIPPDRNILVFQIDPNYTKNGTLDGKVGLVNDANYHDADFERGSYFKPIEAYELKASIERSEQELATFFEQFKSVSKGQSKDPDLSDAAGEQFYDFSSETFRRGIVNTYVWDAYSGLYKSEEQFTATHERVYNGFYSLAWSIGPLADSEVALSQVGVFGGIDLLLGGQIKVQVGKGKGDVRGMGLMVDVPGEPYLASYLGDSKYSAEPTPGKVRTYRFMSFYLPPSTANAEALRNTVVDPIWLNSSDEPNAVALRSARIDGASAWRVLHRVTYVARVPPQMDGSPMQSAAADPQWAITLDNNLLIIQLVHAQLGNAVPTPANIGAAVAAVLAPLDGSTAVLSNVVPWWQNFLDRTKGNKPDPDAVKLLNRIVSNTCAFMTKGYATKVLPLLTPAVRNAEHLTARSESGKRGCYCSGKAMSV